MYREYLKLTNIEVIYQIKKSSIQKYESISKNNNNFNGSSVGLPFKASKVILNTKVAQGLYSNTWVALHNRNQYKPQLIVNNKKYPPVEVNGAFLKYQFEATIPNSIDGKPENKITISALLNVIDHLNSIVGIWFE